MTGVRKSRFARIFGGSAGLDPYTTAVSNVYQDLFGVGTFTGKGIYDVDAFEQAVGNTFPENHILSHDLIEGAYARCGLVTDIELLDDFPASYLVFARREHRWARGDWQILPWLMLRAGHAAARAGDRAATRAGDRAATRINPLPAVERWKIFDNLRRGMAPPALIVLVDPGMDGAARLALVLDHRGLGGPGLAAAAPIDEHSLSNDRAFWQSLQTSSQPRESFIPSGLGNTAAQVAARRRLSAGASGPAARRHPPHSLPCFRGAATVIRMGNGRVRRTAARRRFADVPAHPLVFACLGAGADRDSRHRCGMVSRPAPLWHGLQTMPLPRCGRPLRSFSPG